MLPTISFPSQKRIPEIRLSTQGLNILHRSVLYVLFMPSAVRITANVGARSRPRCGRGPPRSADDISLPLRAPHSPVLQRVGSEGLQSRSDDRRVRLSSSSSSWSSFETRGVREKSCFRIRASSRLRETSRSSIANERCYTREFLR